MTGTPRRVTILSADELGPEIAGAAIRAFELARALSRHAEVTLAAPLAGTAPSAVDGPIVVSFDPHDPRTIAATLATSDVVVAPPVWPRIARALRRSGAVVVFDLYVPEPLETLEQMRDRPRLRSALQTLAIDRLDEALHSGHHLVCASEGQRDLWLGSLLARRLITPASYDRDPTLRSVIDVVPFGVPADPPVASGPGPRERLPGIGPQDRIVLWNGGIWGWLDPATAIRAVALLCERRPEAKLVFMGGSDRPAARRAEEEARAVAGELGVLGGNVLFNDGWVPYAERAAWLLAADCAVSTHHDHLETRFAFRTRLLDCFWSGLPVVCTEGDDLSDRVERDGLGAAVPAGDFEAAAAALEIVLDRGKDAYRDGLARAAAELGWPRVAAPLVRWVEDDGPLPPRIGGGRAYGLGPGQRVRSIGYRAARQTLDTVGLRGWPRL